MGGVPIDHVGKWNGSSWEALPTPGPSGAVYGCRSTADELLVFGAFTEVNGEESHRIAGWNGSSWSTWPAIDSTDPWGSIADAIWYNNELYVCGNFSSSQQTGLADIARWDGNTWQPVGNGFSGGITNAACMHVYQNELYVGG